MLSPIRLAKLLPSILFGIAIEIGIGTAGQNVVCSLEGRPLEAPVRMWFVRLRADPSKPGATAPHEAWIGVDNPAHKM
jgi:hypothetical protein